MSFVESRRINARSYSPSQKLFRKVECVKPMNNVMACEPQVQEKCVKEVEVPCEKKVIECREKIIECREKKPNCFGNIMMYVWVFLIALVITWLLFVFLKPDFVRKRLNGVLIDEVDHGRALMSAVVIAAIVVLVFWFFRWTCGSAQY